ncbi:MAG: DUF3187 family protein [Thermoanaerobaculia bacterium]
MLDLTRPLSVWATALVVILLTPPAVPAQVIEPPMHVASQAPLQSIRLATVPAAGTPPRKGELRVQLTSTWTNVWINERPNLLVDYEATDTRLAATWGLSDTFSVQLEYDERRRFGGRLDSLIQEFHHDIGNGLNGRDTVPRDSIHIEVRDPSSGELLISRHDSSTFARGLSLTAARSRALRYGRLAYSVTLRVPVRYDGKEVSTSSDAGLSLAWAHQLAGRSIHVGAAVARLGRTQLEFPAERLQMTGFAALVQPLTPRTAMIVQYLFNEGVAVSGPLSRSAHEVTVGGRVRLSGQTALDVGLVENIIHFDNGPDVGIHFGVNWTSR